MSAFTTDTDSHLIRSEIWSSQLKDVLYDELMGTKYVNWLNEFPDGDTFTIPSIGQMQVDNYEEDTAVKYRAMDTGEFSLTITEYLSSGTYITNKMKQDSFYMNQLVSSFVPKQARAISVDVETKVLGLSASQTTSNANAINGANHRMVGSGTNETMALSDFAKARYALKKANVPDTNLIAIVDPSVEYALNTLSNLVNVSNNPMWEGIVTSGIASGMKFTKNVFGFDVYVSNRLADANETIGGLTTAAGKANLFFSASSDVLPFIGAWRQMPKVDSSYNKDFQRDEYVTTARYGVKLYRPENLVCVLTDTDQV
jgi:microcompartment protein CcmK/EutM